VTFRESHDGADLRRWEGKGLKGSGACLGGTKTRNEQKECNTITFDVAFPLQPPNRGKLEGASPEGGKKRRGRITKEREKVRGDWEREKARGKNITKCST